MNLKLGRRIDDLLAIKGHSRPTSSAISGQHSEAKALSIQRCAAKYMQYYLFDFFWALYPLLSLQTVFNICEIILTTTP